RRGLPRARQRRARFRPLSRGRLGAAGVHAAVPPPARAGGAADGAQRRRVADDPRPARPAASAPDGRRLSRARDRGRRQGPAARAADLDGVSGPDVGPPRQGRGAADLDPPRGRAPDVPPAASGGGRGVRPRAGSARAAQPRRRGAGLGGPAPEGAPDAPRGPGAVGQGHGGQRRRHGARAAARARLRGAARTAEGEGVAGRRRPMRRASCAVLLLLALAACARSGEGQAPARIVLVSIDTLRADHVGCYGDARASTPTLDGLAAAGARFETVISPAPLTLPSPTTLLPGLDPPAHGVRNNGGYHLRESIPTLAERMHAAGFATAAFVSAFVLDRRFGLARGFDHYDDA